MSATDDFIAHGLQQAEYALLNMRNLTDMVRAPLTLRRGVAQRARARLKLLEVIVRRLVLLLALSLRLAPVRPRAPGSRHPLATPRLPAGRGRLSIASRTGHGRQRPAGPRQCRAGIVE